MIFELRTYDLKPAKAPVYLDNFRRNGVGLVTRHLPLVGYWMTETGRLNRIQHMWAYESLAERDACRANLAADTEWMTGFIPGAFVDVVAQANSFLKLDYADDAFRVAVENRKTVHENQSEDIPMFAGALHALSTSAVKLTRTAATIATFQIISGAGRSNWMTLSGGDEQALLADGDGNHEIMRPLSLSPIR